VAILRGGEAGLLLDGSRVLADEGLRVLEFPLTGPDVLDVVTAAAEALDGRAFVSAGTVRTLDDARRAIDAGARFLVSPGLSVPVVEYASARDIAVLPGTFTPTEIDTALQAAPSWSSSSRRAPISRSSSAKSTPRYRRQASSRPAASTWRPLDPGWRRARWRWASARR
jgi:hypothetical protein